jgi:hypothetical protein
LRIRTAASECHGLRALFVPLSRPFRRTFAGLARRSLGEGGTLPGIHME